MTRSQLTTLPAYFDRYINMNDDVTVSEALQISLREMASAPIAQWKKIGHNVYAPDKWTIADIIQHIIDAERVFGYRALAFARNQENVLPFDENEFARVALASARSLEDLHEEAIAVRKSSLLLFNSFSEAALNKEGNGFKGKYSVQDVGYIIAGHQRWHFRTIEEKYLPLIK